MFKDRFKIALLSCSACCVTIAASNAHAQVVDGTTPSTTATSTTDAQATGPDSNRAVSTPAAAVPDQVLTPTDTTPQTATSSDDIIVTAQRRSESLQKVPIAVSAFTSETLKSQRIEGGSSLQLAVPNVSFTRSNTGTFNFAIRGISNGVGVHVNNAPLENSRLADADFYDVERVEVLRGPQGTLYGRNATSGIVNVITAKPVDRFEASGTVELGNYDLRRLKGYLNVPLGDMFALRLAGTSLNRNGFSHNELRDAPVDDRDLYSVRSTLRFKPNSPMTMDFTFEQFGEHDSRPRFQKQLCITDQGPGQVGGAATNAYTRNLFGKGCAPGPITGPQTLGAYNSSSQIVGLLGDTIGLTSGNVFAGRVQSPDLRSFTSNIGPFYDAKNRLYQLAFTYQLTDQLTLNSTFSYNTDKYTAVQDYNNVEATIPFNPVSVTSRFNGVTTIVAPNGFVTDGQLGTSNFIRYFGGYRGDATQKSQEVRLQSDFGGFFDFDVGAILSRYDTESDYFTGSNALTAYAQYQNAANLGNPAYTPILIDTAAGLPPSGMGHNYYFNRRTDGLKSKAVSGEVYLRPLEHVKLTLGGRYTIDDISRIQYNVPLLVPGSVPPMPGAIRQLTNRKFTYRASADWTPDLGFTDQSLFYASASSGYRNGGPNSVGPNTVYAPETVKAYEIGTRNTLAGGAITVNATAFLYNYNDYQITKALNRIAYTENIDARVKGTELEAVFRPVKPLRLNAQIGYLSAKTSSGTSIDVFDRAAGNPALTYVKLTSGSGCVVPTALAATAQNTANAAAAALGPNATYAQLVATGGAVRALCSNAAASDGVSQQLKGRNLPQAPHWTVSLGAQYEMALPADWSATLRGDYYRQSSNFSRIYNTESDKVPAYENVNLSLTFANSKYDVDTQFFVKNVFDTTAITSIYLSDEAAAFTRNVFLLDPRTYGLSITKRF